MKKLIYEKYTVREKRTVPQPHGPDYVYYVDVEKRRNPQLREVAAIYSHGKSCVAHYRHGKKVWPEDETLKNSIIVELPEEGSLDWAYWVHALARVEERGYSEDNYVRIKIGEKYYYVGAAPAGQKALQVRGGQFYYSDGRAIPGIAAGQVLQVEAKVRESLPFAEKPPLDGVSFFVLDEHTYDVACKTREQAIAEGWRSPHEPDWYYRPYIKRYTITNLPLLPEDIFHVIANKPAAKENGVADIQIYSMPSNTLIGYLVVFACGGKRSDKEFSAALKQSYTKQYINAGFAEWIPQANENIIDGDTYWKIGMYYDYSGGNIQYVNLRFRRDTKGFTRTWQMPVTLTT